MGLIMAALSSVSSTLKDQWKDYFYCEALPKDVLAVKGQRVTKGGNKGSENIISNGSGIVVADGQCMIIVDQGRVVEICAVPGEYTYDMSSEPSIFAGSFGESLKQTFKTIGNRIAHGGDTAKDQRVYYFNTKEILDNKFGTQNPIPFRVAYEDIGRSFTTKVRCNGTYTYKISDPILFYTELCGNFSREYVRSEIDGQLKADFLTALQPAFAKLSSAGIRYDELPGHTFDLCDAVNDVLKQRWSERGISIATVSINSMTIPEEDEERIKKYEDISWNRDMTNAAATMVDANATAVQTAAGNSAGAMTGFMGMGMAQQAGGAIDPASLFAMGQQQKAAQQQQAAQQAAGAWKCSCGAQATGNFCPNCGGKKPAPVQAGGWTCKCGAQATGKFCPECGSPKPSENGWTCSCGTVNQGKFCANCGGKKPEGAPLYKCDKCGWTPEDPHNPPKFCPECGDLFDEKDIQQ